MSCPVLLAGARLRSRSRRAGEGRRQSLVACRCTLLILRDPTGPRRVPLTAFQSWFAQPQRRHGQGHVTVADRHQREGEGPRRVEPSPPPAAVPASGSRPYSATRCSRLWPGVDTAMSTAITWMKASRSWLPGDRARAIARTRLVAGSKATSSAMCSSGQSMRMPFSPVAGSRRKMPNGSRRSAACRHLVPPGAELLQRRRRLEHQSAAIAGVDVRGCRRARRPGDERHRAAPTRSAVADRDAAGDHRGRREQHQDGLPRPRHPLGGDAPW